MPTGWDSILTIILFGDCFTDGLEMLLYPYYQTNVQSLVSSSFSFLRNLLIS